MEDLITSVFRSVEKPNESSGFPTWLKILGGVAVLGLVAAQMNKSSTEVTSVTPVRRRMRASSSELKKEVEDAGLDQEQFVAELEEGITSAIVTPTASPDSVCVVDPKGGVCEKAYELKEGCCILKDPNSKIASTIAVEAVKVGATVAGQFLIKRGIQKVLQKASQKILGKAGAELVGKAGKEAGKQAVKNGLKVGSPAYKAAIREATQKVTQELAEKTLELAIKEATEKATKETAEIAAKNGMKAGSKAYKKAVSEAVQKATKETVEKFAKEIGEKAASKAGGKLGGKVGSKLGSKLTLRMSTRAGSKAASKAAAMVATKAAQKIATGIAAKMAIKLGVGMAKAASKAATGIGAVLAVFDLISMGLDLADPEGYNNFTENSIIQTAINKSEFDMQNEAKRTKRDWPMCFPMDTAFPNEWSTDVSPVLQTKYQDKVLEFLPEAMIDRMTEIESADDPEAAMKKAIADSWAPDPAPADEIYPKDIQDALDTAFLDAMNSNPVERDEIIFDALASTKTINKRHLALYTNMSTKTRIGVGLTEEGVTAWNAKNRKHWFKYYDLFDDAETPPDDFVEPVVALFSRTFRTLNPFDPGDSEKPNMVPQDVPISALGTEFRVIGVEKPRGLQITLKKLSDHLVAGKRSFTDQEATEMGLNYLTMDHFIKAGDYYYKPKHERLGENWRRIPVDDRTKKPLIGNEIKNSNLKSKLAAGITSFKRATVQGFGLPTNMTTDTYIIVNGKAYSPTHHVSLYLRGGHIVSFCEKKRNAKFMGGLTGDVDDSNPGIDPKHFGVRFDDGTFSTAVRAMVEKRDEPIANPAQCVYTDAFCTRMGMKHQYDYYKNTSDCWMDGGQAASEMLFGTTITRGVQRSFHDALGFNCTPPCRETEYCEAPPGGAFVGLLGGSALAKATGVGARCHPKKGVGEKVGPSAGWKCLSGKEVFGTCHNGYRSIPTKLADGTRPEVGFNIITGGAKYCRSMAEDWGKCQVCTGLFGVGNKFCDIEYEGMYWKEHGTTKPGEGKEWVNFELADFISRAPLGLVWLPTGAKGPGDGRELNNSKLSKELERRQEFTKSELDAFKLGNLLPTDYIKSGNAFFEPVLSMTKKKFDEFKLFQDTPSANFLNEKTIMNAKDYIKGTNNMFYRPVLGTHYCENGACHKKVAIGRKVGPTAKWKCAQGAEIFGTCHGGVGSLGMGAEVGFNPLTGGAKYCKSGAEDNGKCVECREHNDCPEQGFNNHYCNYKQAGHNGDNKCKVKNKACLWEDKSRCSWNEHGCHNNTWCENDGFCDIKAAQPNRCRLNNSVPDRPNGQFCDNNKDSQCASGLCWGWTCREPIPPCKELSCHQKVEGTNEPCHRDGDCRKDSYCRKVAFQRNTCRKHGHVKNRAHNEYCESDSQCSTGLCWGYRCKRKLDPCTALSCHQKVDGTNDPCHRNGDCRNDSYCRKVAMQRNTCRKHGHVKNRAHNEYCESDSQCSTGLCWGYRCRHKLAPCTNKSCHQNLDGTNQPCHRDGDCRKDSYCRKVAMQRNTCRKRAHVRRRPPGEYCDNSGQCNSGLCDNWLCRAKSKPCTNPNKSACNWNQHGCHNNSWCADGGYCDIKAAQPNRCRKPKHSRHRDRGEFCTDTYQCTYGNKLYVSSIKKLTNLLPLIPKKSHPAFVKKIKELEGANRGMTCRGWRCKDVRNKNRGCWKQCNKKAGHCDHHCGKDAKCCRFNHWDSHRNGCRGHGGGGKHNCTEV